MFRCQLWVSRCNKPYLAKKTFAQLSMSFKLCSDHFSEDDFVQPSKHRLKSIAIPVFDRKCTFSATSIILNDILFNMQ